MPRARVEIEIKLRVPQAAAARRRLRQAGATLIERVHEQNTIFDNADERLKRSGCLLRVRSIEPVTPRGRRRHRPRHAGVHRPSGLLTFKGPSQGGPYKIREEMEMVVEPAETAQTILLQLGFRPGFRYEKFRTSFRLPGLPSLTIELDETPIGVFLELEGPRQSIDRAAKRLGFGPEDYITASYYDLFLPERRRLGLAADAMLFSAKA